MNPNLAPFIRLGAFIALVAMLLYLPTREFLKTTFMLGIPFVFILAYMRKARKYSLPWIIAIVLVVVTVGGYIYMLTGLPQRIATHQIVIEGTALLTDGKYDDAAHKFSELEHYGDVNTMDEKLALVEKEQDAARLLEQAKALVKSGEKDKALVLLQAVPSDTRAHQEASRLIRNLEE
ncbi:hypothetical protein ASZ90_018919 [hydrocarbon metagenome]|uniref:Tetratricopeptide repeat protein n=1 Tax=hydrocarbon metagenome TaxID=938273 RepID=A0A0W8E4T8_9ZZZZ